MFFAKLLLQLEGAFGRKCEKRVGEEMFFSEKFLGFGIFA